MNTTQTEDSQAVAGQVERPVMQHTLGPWHVLPAEDDKPYLRVRGTVLGSRYKVANVLTTQYKNPPAFEANESRANASLIAAAPELLRCLQAVEVLFAPHCKDSTQADWLGKTQALLRRLGAA